MKIIEAMKRIKLLTNRIAEQSVKINQHSARWSVEESQYSDPKAEVAAWVQSNKDSLAEIIKLKLQIQATNLDAVVSVEVAEGKPIAAPIAYWLYRRNLIKVEMATYQSLKVLNSGGGIRRMETSSGGTQEVKAIYEYDAREKDTALANLNHELSAISGMLEIANATTDLKTV